MDLGSGCGLRIFIFSLAVHLSLSGCELQRETRPSVLVVGVEGLNFNSLSCDADAIADRTFESIRVFCEEAVRFSHAFAPSTMSQVNMSSVMSGLYPFDHGVHHNGNDFLSARVRTLAEGALSQGYRTLFISGGAPIWRKSGLAQGFELFDDNMEISPGVYYRPSEEVFRLAASWIEHESVGKPFFSVLFLGDLQFPQIATRTNEGEVREKTAEAQIAEVTESLNNLVRWLKVKQRWNSTNVVLLGLSSFQHGENDAEPTPLNLKSASVQVTVFIKPARKEKDNSIQWAVDRNVSLVDVGKTMFRWLGLEPPTSSIPALEPENLHMALSQSAPTWREDRMILSETAWPDWLEGSGTRLAVRQDRFLFINDQRPLIFNTLTDRMEVLPLRPNDPLWVSLNAQLMNLVKSAPHPRWKGMHNHWLEQIGVARQLWRHHVADLRPSGKEFWSKWYLRRALFMRDWREVKRIAQALDEPVGIFVASRHLRESAPVPRNACVHLILRGDKNSYQSDCEDERILALHSWKVAKTDEERNLSQERFLRLYSMQLMDEEIGRLNYLSELRWDVDREWPEAPQAVDYLLTLKELESFAKKTSALLSNKNMTF